MWGEPPFSEPSSILGFHCRIGTTSHHRRQYDPKYRIEIDAGARSSTLTYSSFYAETSKYGRFAFRVVDSPNFMKLVVYCMVTEAQPLS